MYRDDKIRALMAVKRLTNEGLAEMTGLSRATIALIRDGRTQNPELSSLVVIAKALGLEMAELFESEPVAENGGPEQKEPPNGSPSAGRTI